MSLWFPVVVGGLFDFLGVFLEPSGDSLQYGLSKGIQNASRFN